MPRWMIVATVLLASSGLLVGCSGKALDYVATQYVVVSDPSLPHDFWIYDRPSENRMLVATAPGAAFQQGFVSGATLGLKATSTPSYYHSMAATMFLTRSGRTCVLAEPEFAVKGNFEVRYECSSAAPATPAQ